VVNTLHVTVDVAMDEGDVALVEAGEKAVVKLESFPTRRFVGKVEILSPASAPEQERRVFYARVNVPNPDGLLRSGMQGYSKVSVGWRPAGYVLFRDFGMWAWTRLWKWFG
jgi:multidrug efflux pump subunit AcrA (membrane-fusion protein)